MTIYKKETVIQKGVLVTLYRYQRNGDEQTIFLKFDSSKVDGHAIKRSENGNLRRVLR